MQVSVTGKIIEYVCVYPGQPVDGQAVLNEFPFRMTESDGSDPLDRDSES